MVRAAGLLARRGKGAVDATKLKAALNRTKAFQETGLHKETQSVWARFPDGRLVIVPTNLAPPAPVAPPPPTLPVVPSWPAIPGLPPLPIPAMPPAALAARDPGVPLQPLRDNRTAALGTDLPNVLVARQFRLLDMFGAAPLKDEPHVTRGWVDQDTLPNIRKIAAARGFNVVDLGPDDDFHFARETTVEGLRSVSGDGVFFINSFGGATESAAPGVFAIATSTSATRRSAAGKVIAQPQYEDDLKAGRLVYMVVPVIASDAPTYRAVFGITPDFARYYKWSFPANSIGFFNVNGAGLLPAWQSMLGSMGLRTIVTWSQPVSIARMLAVAEDFFHLTLATNRLDGPLAQLSNRPRLRNYGNGEAFLFLIHRGVVSPAVLAYFPVPAPAQFVNVLVPTIDWVLLKEEPGGVTMCEMVGQFGANDGGSVRCGDSLGSFAEPLMADAADPPIKGGTALSGVSWRGNGIRARLPKNRDAGYFQVFNGGRWSNAAQITLWKVPVRVRLAIGAAITYDFTIDLRIRADVRGFRLRADQPVATQIPMAIIHQMQRTSAQWTASGALSRTSGGTTTRIEMSGSGIVGTEGPDGSLSFGGLLDLRQRRLDARLAVGAKRVRQRTIITTKGKVTSDTTADLAVDVTFPRDANPFPFRFDDAWNVVAGSASTQYSVQLLGTRAAEITVSWPNVTAQFPPRQDAGGV